MRGVARRILPLILTAGFFLLVFQRVPYQRLLTALGDADYARFLAFMIPNAIIYIAWDTLVLTVAIRWFHGPSVTSRFSPCARPRTSSRSSIRTPGAAPSRCSPPA
jgi:hypothetical protein